MNKMIMLTAILVVGALVAPAANAAPGDDFAGAYCGLIDQLFEDFAYALGCPNDRKPSDQYLTDKASDRSGRDIANTAGDNQQRDGADQAPSGPRDGHDGTDVRCLGCNGLPTPQDTPN